MKPSQRLKLMLKNKKVDRPGVALWKHFSLVDRDPVKFVEKTISFEKENGWDFVKVSYNGFYFVEGWGAKLQWPKTQEESMNMYKKPPFLKYVIDDPYEWDNLKPISVKEGPLAREVEATKKIVEHFKGEVPVLPTIFSPLTSAQEMVGSFVRPDMILAQMKYHPEKVHKALETITEVTIEFLNELIKVGIDGIFFATHFARYDLMTPELYREFGRKYDLAVLEAIKEKTWFNMVHIHGSDNLMFDEIKDYPVQAFNWEDIGSNISLKEAREKTDKILIGGIEQTEDFDEQDREKLKRNLRSRVLEAVDQAGGTKLIIAPGCSIPNKISENGFSALKEIVEELYMEEGLKN